MVRYDSFSNDTSTGDSFINHCNADCVLRQWLFLCILTTVINRQDTHLLRC